MPVNAPEVTMSSHGASVEGRAWGRHGAGVRRAWGRRAGVTVMKKCTTVVHFIIDYNQKSFCPADSPTRKEGGLKPRTAGQTPTTREVPRCTLVGERIAK